MIKLTPTSKLKKLQRPRKSDTYYELQALSLLDFAYENYDSLAYLRAKGELETTQGIMLKIPYHISSGLKENPKINQIHILPVFNSELLLTAGCALCFHSTLNMYEFIIQTVLHSNIQLQGGERSHLIC